MENLLAKGKNIFQLTTFCDKYETEREKVQIFKCLTISENVEETNEQEEPLKDFKEVVVIVTFTFCIENIFIFILLLQLNLHVVSKMENFWIRFKNVEIDCACLEEERRVLKSENEIAKDKLKQYFKDISMMNGRGESTKHRIRPHSVKIENVPCNGSLKQFGNVKRPVTGVEGNLSVAVRSKSLVKSNVKTPQIHSIVN